MKKIFSVLLLIFIIASCNKDDLTITSNKEDLLDQIEFLDDFPKIMNSEEESTTAHGINVRIARPKHNCKRGLGLCKIKSNPKPQLPDPPVVALGTEKTLAIHTDSKGNYIQLLFANKVPSELGQTDLDFHIDMDLETEMGEIYYFIEKKVIKVDRSLGEFGGYKIYLD